MRGYVPKDDVVTTGFLMEEVHKLDRICEVNRIEVFADDSYSETALGFGTCRDPILQSVS